MPIFDKFKKRQQVARPTSEMALASSEDQPTTAKGPDVEIEQAASIGDVLKALDVRTAGTSQEVPARGEGHLRTEPEKEGVELPEGERYVALEDADGWYVEDRQTGWTAQAQGLRLERLSAIRARSLADIMNRIDRLKAGHRDASQ